MPFKSKEEYNAYMRKYKRERREREKIHSHVLISVRQFPEYQALTSVKQLELDRVILDGLTKLDKMFNDAFNAALKEMKVRLQIHYGQLTHKILSDPELRARLLALLQSHNKLVVTQKWVKILKRELKN